MLSPDDLAAHVQILRSQAVVDSAKQTKKPRTSEAYGCREVEVVLFNDQKSSVYVFDGNSTEEAFVVMEVWHLCFSNSELERIFSNFQLLLSFVLTFNFFLTSRKLFS